MFLVLSLIKYNSHDITTLNSERKVIDVLQNEKYHVDDLQNLDKCIEDDLKKLMNDQMTLIEFIEAWLEMFKLNSIKIASYKRLVSSKKTLESYEISRNRICDITFFDIQRYINTLTSDGYSLSNIKKQTLIVTAPLKQAAAMRIIPADPCIGVRLPSEAKVQKKAKEVIAYSKEEQDKLWKNIIKEPDNAGYAAVAFQMETGLRAGELLALKWSDVDIQHCKMRIHATIIDPQYTNKAKYQSSAKSKSSHRTIPLTPKAIAILRRLQSCRTTEWVFEKYNDRLSYQQLTYQTRKLCREAKVKYQGEHVFRHTFATNCYYKGIDVKILSRLMGHSSVQVTYNIYINLYGDGFDDMYAALCF